LEFPKNYLSYERVTEVDDRYLLSVLLQALPILAGVTDGFATVTDRCGCRLKTVNSNGEELEEHRNSVYDLAEESARLQKALIGPSQIVKGAVAWAVPIGPYVLSCSNVERAKRENSLQQSLEKALPLIANVVGGEAVLFDREGKRIISYNPNGTINKQFLNKISEHAKRAMETDETLIRESFSFEGAMAVRIPITQAFGLGFNNELTAMKSKKLMDEVQKFQYARYSFSDIVGEHEAITRVIHQAEQIADGTSTVLIYGETGTGKELFAQSIHNASKRRNKPFVAINCGALPVSLIEGTLFGYVDGAYTGAKKGGAPGSFEMADGGTIFLDEISEMELNLQSKLLRVLQEREVTRIGAGKPIHVDVRVLASTNKDMGELVASKKFRNDLYFRLNVVQVNVPPLRDRISDIRLLADHFIRKYDALLGKYVLEANKEALAVLQRYTWPGNIRELQNCVEHALNMVRKDERVLLTYHLPLYIRQNGKISPEEEKAFDPDGMTLESIMAQTERRVIETVLHKTDGRKKDAARILGISTTTLWRKIQALNLQE
jgi:transcriptional regulator with PAS, ATPase and Fis domain